MPRNPRSSPNTFLSHPQKSALCKIRSYKFQSKNKAVYPDKIIVLMKLGADRCSGKYLPLIRVSENITLSFVTKLRIHLCGNPIFVFVRSINEPNMERKSSVPKVLFGIPAKECVYSEKDRKRRSCFTPSTFPQEANKPFNFLKELLANYCFRWVLHRDKIKLNNTSPAFQLLGEIRESLERHVKYKMKIQERKSIKIQSSQKKTIFKCLPAFEFQIFAREICIRSFSVEIYPKK